MKQYKVILTGRNPLLLHHDDIDWSDAMAAWRSDPKNKKLSVAGDDRSPAWRWIGCCYHDKKQIVVPQGNIMRSIMEGGAMVPVPGGKMGKTFKAQTQSGMMSVDPYWPLYINGAPIAWSDIEAMRNLEDFSEHADAVAALGFSLLVRRAKIGTSKHVRVRPEFPAGWELRGTLAVWDEQITKAALLDILTFAGNYKGLGDWRPGGKTPGPYGTFDVKIE